MMFKGFITAALFLASVTFCNAATSTFSNGQTIVVCGGSSSINDTPVLQAAIDAGPTIVVGVCYHCPLNLTNRSPYLHGVGSRNTDFNPSPSCSADYATTYGHMFDFTGSYLINVGDFSIGWNNPSVVARDSLFLAASNPQTANIAKFSNIFIKGQFKSTGIYGYGFFNATFDNVFVQNSYPGANTAASAVYLTSHNGWSLTSQFATLATGSPTLSQWRFVNGSEIHVFPGTGGNSSAIYLDGVSDVQFSGVNISAGGSSYISVTGNNPHLLFHGNGFGTESEPSTPSSIFYLNSGSSISDISFIVNDYTGPIYAGPGSHP